MFKQLFSAFALTLSLGASTLFTACIDDETGKAPTKVTPTNLPLEMKNTARAEIVFVEGHLHGLYGFHENVYPQEMKYIGRRDTLRYTLENGTWKADAKNPKALPLQGGKAYPPVYAIIVKYYDQQGQVLNEQIEANDKLYQTFYYLTDIRPTNDGVAEDDDENGKEFFQYLYCDTKPWNKTVKFDKAQLTGPQNPVGMKGYIKFNKSRKFVTLNIHLMKALSSKIVGQKEGEDIAAPYYKPTTAQLKEAQWLPTIQVPINLYMDVAEKGADDFDELDIKEEDLSKAGKRAVYSIMQAFGISYEEALAELYYNINGKRPSHDNHSGFWF